MKHIFIAILVSIISSFIYGKVITSDNTLSRYKAAFDKKANRTCATVLQFGSFKDGVIGVCQQNKNIVKIDKVSFENYSSKERIALVFHELGHCCLDRRHVDERFEDLCFKSIMGPYMPTQQCLEKHWDHYMTELFN